MAEPQQPQIEVRAGMNRPSPAEQIATLLTAARERNEPTIRMRIPFMLFDPATKNYTQIRDAFWHLTMVTETTDVAQIEGLMEALGKCILAISTKGWEEVLRVVEEAAQPSTPAGEEPQ